MEYILYLQRFGSLLSSGRLVSQSGKTQLRLSLPPEWVFLTNSLILIDDKIKIRLRNFEDALCPRQRGTSGSILGSFISFALSTTSPNDGRLIITSTEKTLTPVITFNDTSNKTLGVVYRDVMDLFVEKKYRN